MKFIIGLGNPGLLYKKTRHNVGFLALDFFVEQVFDKKNKWQNKDSLKAEILETNFNDQQIILVKPQTFMNDSGQTITLLKKKYPQLTAEDLIVIHDDVDLPLGKIRIKTEGSAGGHNGIKSIIQHLGGQDFTRIKIGISNELQAKVPLEKFVLQRFDKNEFVILEESLAQIPNIITDLLSQNIEAVMCKYN
ncbi:MAG: aminoacyl-tRNA hydrolase [Patescibacteria group bacterium]